ncbi:MAG: ribonuclease H family protein [Bacteroidales bacterium]|nr:ribonuclease H family protein [Bacteroidales bacterium]
MAKKNKFYVVWQGKNPGIYSSWAECKSQVEGVAAKYMGFETKAEAELAFSKGYEEFYGKKGKKTELTPEQIALHGKPIGLSIAVDAAFNGKLMEYQGVFVETNTKIFHFGPVQGGTNNIGEFLALVHVLAYQKQHKMNYPIYTDSKTAMSWVRLKRSKTELTMNQQNKKIFELITRAEKWLNNNDYSMYKILKWKTEIWGEIPADFGRK